MTLADKSAWIAARAEAYEKSLAHHSVPVESAPAPAVSQPPTLTADEIKEIVRAELAEKGWSAKAFVERQIAQYHEGEEMRPVTRAVLKGLVDGIRSEVQEQIGLLRADLTIAKAADRGADVVETIPHFLQRRHEAA